MKRSWTKWLLLIGSILAVAIVFLKTTSKPKTQLTDSEQTDWHPPDISLISSKTDYAKILYGKELISHTSKYLGPKGLVAPITNGMNCQNCHIDAGAKLYGNSFAAVAANYPQFKNRSGMIESIEFRINDCLQRSLNGKMLDSLSPEMQAMVAYVKWIGKDVPAKTKPKGAGTTELAFLRRAADTLQGKVVYINKCAVCHGKTGEGLFNQDSSGYIYPPLWGIHSYNDAAGLYRLTRFAAFIKYNMPFNTASHVSPLLTDEQAWDAAAFVNSQPRPTKSFKNDWPDIRKKAIDYPVGPFTDTFSSVQHKYGPFEPIEQSKKNVTTK